MNNKSFIILIVAIILIVVGVYLWVEKPSCLFGTNKINNFDECVAAGNEVLESYPRQCRTDGQVFVEDIGNILDKKDLIMVDNITPNQIVTSPLKISGEARGYWFFEASFPIKIEDSNGNVLGIAIAQAQGDWMTEDFVPFKADLTFENSETQKGNLILIKDNPTGLSENDDELRMPVVFGEPGETMTVNVYFNNNELDPNITCTEVFPVERDIPKTQAVGRAALEELLKGTSVVEQQGGYYTNINPGVTINSLTIEDGVAKVDFNEQLENQVGGSCKVSAIRSQIVETLKQFPTVDEVVIAINGRTEDILQP